MDALSPEIKIKLDKERTLKFDLRGMRRYQELTSKNPLEPQKYNLNDINELEALLISCLLHEDENISIETIRPYVTPFNIRLIQMLLIQALNLAVVEKDGKAEDKRPLSESRLPG